MVDGAVEEQFPQPLAAAGEAQVAPGQAASAPQPGPAQPAQNHWKNNRFPFLDKNTHKNPKFGRVRQVPTRELGWEFPGWDLSHFAKFGIFVGIL